MRIIELTGETKKNILNDLLKRSPNHYGEYEETVNDIIRQVRERGDEAVFAYTEQFDQCRLTAENLVVTLLAGVMGLLLSVAFAYLGNTLLFAQEFSQTLSPPAVDASILLHGSTFGWALLFCFVLNLLSSGIPAWRASRIGIVNALGGRLHK